MAGAFLTSDIDDMLQLSDFATASTFGGGTINVIFDAEFLANDVGGQVEIATSAPVAYAKTSDVSAAAQGPTITIPTGGTAYTVVGREDDNTGITMLRLRT